jgi:glutamate 5-kinase
MSSTVVAKIGSSSITDDEGHISAAAIAKLCAEVAQLRADGHRCVIVTSGAISAGLPLLGLGGARRPRDSATLQAVSAVGQGRLIGHYMDELAGRGLVGGQVLLTPLDFIVRAQYVHARTTMQRLLDLGVVPIVNENDAVADDEIRFGDNDRIAALVAHLVDAQHLVLLTDTAGVFTADPRTHDHASLIEEIIDIDAQLLAAAGGAGSARGSGGMASKLAAAKIATWSGVRAVIAQADRPNVLLDAVAGVAGVGSVFVPKPHRLGARKLWIAFAVAAEGRVTVDDGARIALVERGVSLLGAGVTDVAGSFDAGSALEICDQSGHVFAKGLARHDAATSRSMIGRRTSELPGGMTPELVHRDDLVIVPGH